MPPIHRSGPIALVAALVAVAACGRCNEPPRTKPEVIIEDGHIRFEGKALPLGAPQAVWEKVLGPSREADIGGWHMWDELGLSVLTVYLSSKFEREGVKGLTVSFRRFREFGPKKPFTGTLILDGTRIHPGMTSFPKWHPCHFQIGRPLHTAYSCDDDKTAYAIGIGEDGRVSDFEVDLMHFPPNYH